MKKHSDIQKCLLTILTVLSSLLFSYGQDDSIFAYDRFGRSYSIQDLTIPNTGGARAMQSNTCQAGFFLIDFTDANGSGFNNNTNGADMRTVVCHVFEDLSQLIVPANNPYTGSPNVAPFVNIEVRNTNRVLDPNIIADASPFFVNYEIVKNSTTNRNGIIDGEVYRTINGGFDSWYAYRIVNGTANGMFHGFIEFNFPDFPTNLFYTDLATPSPVSMHDLYQITLHEAIHTLGFYSLIVDATGASWMPNTQFYSRFDAFLESNGTKIISNTNSCGTLQYSGASVTANCNTNFISSSVNVPVFTQSPFIAGLCLSHLDAQCAPVTTYVMQQSSTLGFIRRPTQVEVNILCNLNYQTTNTFGVNPTLTTIYKDDYIPCGERIAGVDDLFQNNTSLFYETQPGVSITISDFLSNDNDNGSPVTNYDQTCLRVLNNSGIATPISNTAFTFLPNNNFSGWAVVRYMPASSNGERGNFTLVFIRVMPVSTCTNNCNLVEFGDFETIGVDMVPLSDFLIQTNTFTSTSNTSDLYSWTGTGSNPWKWLRFPLQNLLPACTTVRNPVPPSHNGQPQNKQYAGIVGSTNSHQQEGLSFPLCQPLIYGNTYTLSFWTMKLGANCQPNIGFWVSPEPPCYISWGPTIINGTNNCNGHVANFTFTPLQNFSITDVYPSWGKLQATFTYTGPANQDNLLVTFNNLSGTPYVLLDDISLTCKIDLTATQTSTCTGQCNGAIDITATGCVTPFTYAWTNTSNPTAEDQTGLCNGNYSVTVTDQNGCTTGSTYSITPGVCDPFTLSKTSNYTGTYAGHPIVYTVTACNNSSSTASVVLTDVLPQANFVVVTTPPNWPTFPNAATIPLPPLGCTDFVYIGYFTQNGFCSDGPEHTNTVTMIASGQTYTASQCVDVSYLCPMVSYGNSNCVLNDPVTMSLGVHTQLLGVNSVRFYLVYPEYITPPTSLTATNVIDPFGGLINLPTCSIGNPQFHMNSMGINYNKVYVEINYSSPVDVTPPNLFVQINFTYTTQIPQCQNAPLCWVISPHLGPGIGDYQTDIYQSTNPNPPMSLYTQALRVYFSDCSGCNPPDASFTVSQSVCDAGGCITFTGTNTSPTAIHIWEFGDDRTTPMNGARITTYCYLDPITNNAGFTWPGMPPGTYTVKHTVTDNGQSGFQTMQVHIYAPLTVTATGTSLCTGSTVNLSASGADTYTWNQPVTCLNTPCSTATAAANIPSTYVVTGTNTSNGCTSTASVTVCTTPTLTVYVWLEGFYNTSTNEMVTVLSDFFPGDPDIPSGSTDYVTISLYDDVNCIEVLRETGILHKDGIVTVPLSNLTAGNSYWIRVEHRNHANVWSAYPLSESTLMTPGANYIFQFNGEAAFSTGVPYGYSQKFLESGTWGMFAGDINGDDGIDSQDMTYVDVCSNLGCSGYIVEDLNGDGAADSQDMTLIENNSNMGAFAERPGLCANVLRKSFTRSNSIEIMEVSVYPNPGKDNIKVVTQKDNCLLKITNTIGKVVYVKHMDYQTNINVAIFPRGIYFVTVERDGFVKGKTKIVLQ